MTPRRLRRGCLEFMTLCIAVLTVAGCVNNPGDDEMQNLKTVPRAEAERMTDDHARRVVAMIGSGVKLNNPGHTTPPCDGAGGKTSDTVYYAAGHYQIAPVQEDQQLPTLRRLREQWQQQGYTIKRDRVFPDGKTGELAVESPGDEFEIHLESTEPPIAFAVLISSPCYRSDEPWPPPVSDSPTDGG